MKFQRPECQFTKKTRHGIESLVGQVRAERRLYHCHDFTKKNPSFDERLRQRLLRDRDVSSESVFTEKKGQRSRITISWGPDRKRSFISRKITKNFKDMFPSTHTRFYEKFKASRAVPRFGFGGPRRTLRFTKRWSRKKHDRFHVKDCFFIMNILLQNVEFLCYKCDFWEGCECRNFLNKNHATSSSPWGQVWFQTLPVIL